jgi:nucleoside-diphosphate-sugar epimerase
MQHTVLITGAAGYVGAMLCDKFSKRTDVERIIGLDVEPLPEMLHGLKKLTWMQANTADESWKKVAHEAKPDIVIHAAWHIREMYGRRQEQWRWNVEGSDAIFDFAFTEPSVKRLVHFSTVASYGSFPGNSVEYRYTENDPFRESDYSYAEEKRVVEEHLKERFEKAHKAGSHVQVAIIRPAAITGPRGRYARIRFGLQSALSGQLRGNPVYKLITFMVSFVPVTPKWLRQFVHEDDITDIAELLAFEPLKNPYDAFIACPPGEVVRGPDMARAVHKRLVPMPPFLIRIAFFLMWHLTRGRVPTARGAWKGYSYPIAVDGQKITRMYGYTYRMSSKDAFVLTSGRYESSVPPEMRKKKP